MARRFVMALLLAAVPVTACGGDDPSAPPPPSSSMDAGPPPPAAPRPPLRPSCSTPEVEPNDAHPTASPLGARTCGVLSSADTLDVVTYSLPPGTQTFELVFSANVKLRLFVGDQGPFEISALAVDPTPVDTSAPYLIEVRPAAVLGLDEEIAWSLRPVVDGIDPDDADGG